MTTEIIFGTLENCLHASIVSKNADFSRYLLSRGAAMARSKCPACEHHEFEAVHVTTQQGQKFCLIQCVNCGTVVGALDDVKITNVIKNAEKKLSKFLENLNRKVINVCNRKNS